jgi:hypothetical protein
MATLPISSTRLQPPAAGLLRRGILALVVVAAAYGATLLAEALPGRSFEPDLARVIAFMSLVKAAIAALALAAIGWRLGQPIGRVPTIAVLGIAAGLAAAPILVWQGVLLGVTSLVFHAGLLALGGLAVAEHRAVMRGG